MKEITITSNDIKNAAVKGGKLAGETAGAIAGGCVGAWYGVLKKGWAATDPKAITAYVIGTGAGLGAAKAIGKGIGWAANKLSNK